MDIASVLVKHDLDLSTVTTPEGLVKLRNAYSELLNTLSADSETQQNREKMVRDEMLNDNPAEDWTDISDAIRNTIADEVSTNPDLLPTLCEMLQTIKQDLMVMRDFHVQSVVRENKPEKVKDSEEIETRKEEASTLRDAIVSVFTLMGKPTDIEGFPTKKSEKTNEVSPDLPRVPIGASTTGAIRGRGAKVRQMQFEIDGNALPAGMLFYDIVNKHLCDFANGFVIKPSDIVGMINDLNEKDASNPKFTVEGYENKWTVEINGHTLSGWLPVEK